MDIILSYDKHGTIPYANALTLVRERLADGYWYDDEDEATARRAVEANDEDAAWRFLRSRKDAEYEGVERVPVRGAS